MVSFDENGRQIESRYMKIGSKFNEFNWSKANKARKGFYNVENVMFNDDKRAPVTGTFVENTGRRYANKTPIRFGNVWVIGQDNIGGWFKMVSFNVNGKQVESRYMKVGSKLNEINWNNANKAKKGFYNV
jgi:hypothetical protein